MNFQVLREQLDKGQKQNFYILTGEEKEVMRQYIKRISPVILEVESYENVKPRLNSVSLFSNFDNTYVIYNDKTVQEYEVKDIVRTIGSDILVLVYDKIDNRVNFFKKASSFIYEFPKFSEKQLVGYIQGRVDISSELAELLALYCNNEVARIDNELHKLRHAQATISRELLDELVTPPPTDAVFTMADLVAKNSIQEAFNYYDDLVRLNESPISMLAVLYMKFKQVFLVQSQAHLSNEEIAAKTGLNQWVIHNTRDCLNRYTLEQLINILKLIQQTEMNMKTGKEDIKVGFTHLLIKLLWRNI